MSQERLKSDLTTDGDNAAFLQPAKFIDSDELSVVAFARACTNELNDDREKALALYYAVRDGVHYDVYLDYTNPANFRASGVLKSGRGFCIGKACLLGAVCRAVGIPARVGYADVRNHMTSRRLQEMMKTDVFSWHSYTDLRIDGRWVKATPAFDIELCDRIGVAPLEFDGKTDSLFQPSDSEGRRRMEYLRFRGAFADVPFGDILKEFRSIYPGLIAAGASQDNFRAEATGHF